MAQGEHTFLSEYSKFLDSSDKHFTYSALSLYHNNKGDLSEKEVLFFLRHLDSCASCARRLQEVKEVEAEPSRERKAIVYLLNTPVFRYSIAAVIVIAVGLSVVYFWSRSGIEQSGSSQLSNKSLALETQDPQRFIPNATLESFVGRTVRSASGVRLFAPGIGDTITTPFTFQWEGGKAGEEYTLEIVDNKNTVVWKGTAHTGTLSSEKRLQPGLYYAKLEADGVLAQVGKFIVADRHQ